MNQSQLDFVRAHACDAIQACMGSHIYPQTLLAQAILESASGKSGLTKDANNFFGVKADSSWAGPKILKATTEFINSHTQSYFRVYSGFEASARDYIKFFNSSRYSDVRKATNYKDQIKAIKAAGYATDPDYVSKVTSLADAVNGELNSMREQGKLNCKAPGGIAISQDTFVIGLMAITFFTTYIIYVRRKS